MEDYDADIDEKTAVLVFLITLLQSDIGHLFNRNFSRAVKKAWKKHQPDKQFVQQVSEAFSDISEDDWGVE